MLCNVVNVDIMLTCLFSSHLMCFIFAVCQLAIVCVHLCCCVHYFMMSCVIQRSAELYATGTFLNIQQKVDLLSNKLF